MLRAREVDLLPRMLYGWLDHERCPDHCRRDWTCADISTRTNVVVPTSTFLNGIVKPEFDDVAKIFKRERLNAFCKSLGKKAYSSRRVQLLRNKIYVITNSIYRWPGCTNNNGFGVLLAAGLKNYSALSPTNRRDSPECTLRVHAHIHD